MTLRPDAPEVRDFEVRSRVEPVPGPGNAAVVVTACLLAAGGAVAFVIGLFGAAPPAILGAALATAFFSLAVAVRRSFAALYPRISTTEHRKAPAGPSDELAAAQPVARRTLLMRLLAATGGVLLLSLLAPIRSLANRRLGVQEATAWQAGTRLVDDDGQPLRPEDVPTGGLSRAWPEATARQELAALIVIRLEGEEAQEPTNLDWVVDGTLVAYSKVCTHAGCPVALYQARQRQLFCPCHQASFDAVRGATPTFGPASRPLPQLPLGVDDDGYLVALGDFVQPVGPPVG
jgi:ubiquinol-cytochrome c reductase iron-sulfur subunit